MRISAFRQTLRQRCAIKRVQVPAILLNMPRRSRNIPRASNLLVGREDGTTTNSIWTVQTGSGLGGKQLQGNQGSDSDRRLLSWDVIPANDPNIEILAKVMSHTTTGGTVARVGLRASGTGTQIGYFAALNRSLRQLSLDKIS